MTVIDDVLSALGLAKVPAAARNLLRFPVPTTAPTVVEGVLAHLHGDLTTDTSLRPRVSYVLGPGATLGGVTFELTDLIATITTRTTTAPVPDRATVVQAFQTYATTHLTNTPADRLQVGLRMPLPIEIDVATGNWVTNLETIQLWARTPPPIALAWNQPVAPLPIPDPDVLATEAAAALAGVADASTLGIGLVARMLRNPFEAVFWIHEVFGQVRRTRTAADVMLLALEMCESMVDHQAQLLASTTAGNGVLRLLWFSLADVDISAMGQPERGKFERSRDLLGEALGLAALPPAGSHMWQSPYLAGPTVTPRELPLPAASTGLQATLAPAGSIAAIEAASGRQVMVLGRQLSAGTVGTYSGYTGAAHVGRVLPDAFVAAHRDLFNPGSDPVIDERAAIVVAIAPNEGRLDAARLRDRGMLSTGLQQWTEHGNDEATVLWEHFRCLAPEQYDLHFGLARLLPQVWVAADVAATPVPSTADLTAINPWADATVLADPLTVPLLAASTHVHFPRFVTLFRLDAGTRVRMPQSSTAGIGPRFAFFGGTGAAGARVFADDWAARARLVALVSLDYRTAELEVANKRFDRIARDTLSAAGTADFTIPGAPSPGGGAPPPRFTVADLFTTQFGAALVLDHHINAPGFVKADVQTTANTTAGSAFDAAGNLEDDWLERFATRYRVVRRFADPAIKTQRDNFIVGLPAGTLSRDAGSFAGW